MRYDGKDVSLPPEAEEVAGFFAALIESDHGKNPTFQQNFFDDWVKILKDLKVVCPLTRGLTLCVGTPDSGV
jgi:DNA topoisomerase-1